MAIPDDSAMADGSHQPGCLMRRLPVFCLVLSAEKYRHKQALTSCNADARHILLAW